MKGRYSRSGEQLERALKVIPLGAQTFSKSITQYPAGVSPHFASHGRGSSLWDVDGNEYLDLINALGAVLLGYAHAEVDAAVRKQLEKGVSFSLSHELEFEVAERLVELIPCAEQVRFGKNGTDATSAAVRLARAYTGRDHVAVCGYHGWQDWFIGTTTRSLGVPADVNALSHSFPYNDLAALEKLLASHPQQFATVIMEPMNSTYPQPGYLEGVRELTRKHGTLLVFDETLTGFRLHLGGAQALFGVTPDLATFGKGMANGFPLSAVVGTRQHMAVMEDIFFSGTFGGETLSLAAARAVLDILERDQVPEQLQQRGQLLRDGLAALIEDQGLGDVFTVSGHPSWSFLSLAATKHCSVAHIKTLMLQELFARGVLCLGSHNLSAAHSVADLDRLLGVYRELLPWLHECAVSGNLHEHLRTEPLMPLFTIR